MTLTQLRRILILATCYRNATNDWRIDHSVTYIIEKTFWWIPHPPPLAFWKHIIYVFEPNVWGILVFAVIVFTSIWIALEYFTQHIKDPTKLIFYMLAIFLQNVYPIRGHHLRSMIICWIWFSLIISISFNANFYSVLTRPFYEHKITTLNEAAATNEYRFGFSTLYDPAIKSTYPKNIVNTLFKHRIKNCGLSFKCLNDSVESRDLIVAKGYIQTKFFIPKYYVDAEGNPLIYSLPRPLHIINLNMVMVKGYPLLDKFNELLLRMRANGLITKWFREFLSMGNRRTVSKVAKTASERMSLDKTWLAFMVWYIGSVPSILCFLIELSCKRISFS